MWIWISFISLWVHIKRIHFPVSWLLLWIMHGKEIIFWNVCRILTIFLLKWGNITKISHFTWKLPFLLIYHLLHKILLMFRTYIYLSLSVYLHSCSILLSFCYVNNTFHSANDEEKWGKMLMRLKKEHDRACTLYEEMENVVNPFGMFSVLK